MAAELVTFVCVQEGSKIRVKIETANYHPNANCQFPRNLRQVGARFTAPRTAVTFARGAAGTVFYRVNKQAITPWVEPVASSASSARPANFRVYEVDENPTCSVCFSENKSVVFIPCGHYCTCAACAGQIVVTSNKCPICRTRLEQCVPDSQI